MKVGAGRAEIIFDERIFPVEGFNGIVADYPHARVVILDSGEKVAIVALELVNAPEGVLEGSRKVLLEKADIKPANVWIHSTHAIATPHLPVDKTGGELFIQSVVSAVEKAVEQAAQGMQEARVGAGCGLCDINANINVISPEGKVYNGLGSTLPSNKKLTVLRFDTLAGDPIVFFLSYGIKPTCIGNAEMEQVTRKLSSDVPGYACNMMESEFGVPCMFCMSAAGDQIPKWVSHYQVPGEDGEPKVIDCSVAESLKKVAEQGRVMGDACIEVAKSIDCAEDARIGSSRTAYTWINRSGDGEVGVTVDGIIIGDDIALVGFKPEVNSITEKELWERSPYEHTLLVSFMNGDQKYMPHDEAYDILTREVFRSGCGRGCAEEFVNVSADMLQKAKKGEFLERKDELSGIAGNAVQMAKEINFGGRSWYVLEDDGKKQFVISKYVHEFRPYHGQFTAVTWETSDIRKYLNGEFYEKTFSSEEKARIIEQEMPNPSNPKYGTGGGNPTADRVFLPSIPEAQMYLGGFMNLIIAWDPGETEAKWWHLRSPGEGVDTAANVDPSGLINYHGPAEGVLAYGGIRPAMWIKK